MAVTVKEPVTPAVKLVLEALVITGAWFTVRVKLCVAAVPTPFCAVKVTGKEPPAVAVPPSTPVVALNVTPDGNVPDSANVGAGYPVVTTVKEPAVPAVKIAAEALPGATAGSAKLRRTSFVTVRSQPCLLKVAVAALVRRAYSPYSPSEKLCVAAGRRAVKVTGKEPPAVAVPPSTPVAALKAHAGGNGRIGQGWRGTSACRHGEGYAVPTVKVVVSARNPGD